MVVGSIHLEWFDDPSVQTLYLADYFATETKPVIILGDFNLEPDGSNNAAHNASAWEPLLAAGFAPTTPLACLNGTENTFTCKHTTDSQAEFTLAQDVLPSNAADSYDECKADCAANRDCASFVFSEAAATQCVLYSSTVDLAKVTAVDAAAVGLDVCVRGWENHQCQSAFSTCIMGKCNAASHVGPTHCSGYQLDWIWFRGECSVVRCGAVQFSAVQCNAAQYNARHCKTVRCGVVQSSAVQRSAIQSKKVRCSAVQRLVRQRRCCTSSQITCWDTHMLTTIFNNLNIDAAATHR